MSDITSLFLSVKHTVENFWGKTMKRWSQWHKLNIDAHNAPLLIMYKEKKEGNVVKMSWVVKLKTINQTNI